MVHKLSDYLKHAEECRYMARTASPEHKSMLEQMAKTWEQMAETRRRHLDQRGVAHDQDDGL
jgi:hypothetical protein